MAAVPHFSLPVRQRNGVIQTSEQDTHPERADCVEAVLRYTPGWRASVPNFGVPPQEFAQGAPDVGEIEEAVTEWEPRALVAYDGGLDPLDEALARVEIDLTGDVDG